MKPIIKPKEVKDNLSVETYVYRKDETATGLDLIRPGSWVIVSTDSDVWRAAQVTVFTPGEDEDITTPEEFVEAFINGVDNPRGRDYTSVWVEGADYKGTPVLDKDGGYEISFGGYWDKGEDSGPEVITHKFLFKDVTVDSIVKYVEKLFDEEINNLFSEINEQISDSEAYNRDPSAYYGVGDSDFYSAKSTKKRW